MSYQGCGINSALIRVGRFLVCKRAKSISLEGLLLKKQVNGHQESDFVVSYAPVVYLILNHPWTRQNH